MTYQLTKAMFNAILKTRKGNDLKLHPYKYVAQVINNEFGILGGCGRVVIKG